MSTAHIRKLMDCKIMPPWHLSHHQQLDMSLPNSPYSSGSSLPETPQVLDRTFDGWTTFDDMDQFNLSRSFSRFDCGDGNHFSFEEEIIKKMTNVLHIQEHGDHFSYHDGSRLYITKSPNGDEPFLLPPKSILREPLQQFAAIPNNELRRPQPLCKQQDQSPADPFQRGKNLSKKARKGKSRQNTVNSQRIEDIPSLLSPMISPLISPSPLLPPVEKGCKYEKQYCGYCKSIGMEYKGHSKQKCPRIGLLDPCKLCGATGYENHTATHCPSSQKVFLELDPAFCARLKLAQQSRNV